MPDPFASGPMGLAERRLAWLDRRQEVLAQNIANADTPGFRARDVAGFADVLARRGGAGLRATDPRHLVGTRGTDAARADRLAAERTPDGNGVSLDTQALKVAETEQAQALAMGLHRKYLGLFRTALGRGQ